MMAKISQNAVKCSRCQQVSFSYPPESLLAEQVFGKLRPALVSIISMNFSQARPRAAAEVC
jgi:hypothetical protein